MVERKRIESIYKRKEYTREVNRDSKKVKSMVLAGEDANIIMMYVNGMSSREIAKVYDVSHGTILRILKENGVERRDIRIYKVNENAFDNLDDEETLYWLGFLMADGCVYRDKKAYLVIVKLKASDKRQLEKFRRFMSSDVPIREFMDKAHGKEYPKVAININSKKLVDRFIELGFDKERKNTFPQWMTEERFKHWLRGLWDGDGTIGFKSAHGGKNRYLYVQLVGYYELVSGVEEWLVRILGVKRNEIYKHGDKIYMIKWESSDAEKIAEYLYGDVNVYLDRKYETYRKWKESKENKELEGLVVK